MNDSCVTIASKCDVIHANLNNANMNNANMNNAKKQGNPDKPKDPALTLLPSKNNYMYSHKFEKTSRQKRFFIQ